MNLDGRDRFRFDILYPHGHSLNFGFSHSAGDRFAEILNDSSSQPTLKPRK